MKKGIKKVTKKINNVTDKVIVGTATAGMTIGCCAICSAMDLVESAMAIGAIALITPGKLVNTNAEIIKGMYKTVKEA